MWGEKGREEGERNHPASVFLNAEVLYCGVTCPKSRYSPTLKL